MATPEYVSAEDVRQACGELKIRDWSDIKDSEVLAEEAGKILAAVNSSGMPIDVEGFRQGLQVELEHGTLYDDANVTNNHPILTGKIVLAHMKESLDYYQRLDVAEIKGDLLKALVAGNPQKLADKYRKLVEARYTLAQSERAATAS